MSISDHIKRATVLTTMSVTLLLCVFGGKRDAFGMIESEGAVLSCMDELIFQVKERDPGIRSQSMKRGGVEGNHGSLSTARAITVVLSRIEKEQRDRVRQQRVEEELEKRRKSEKLSKAPVKTVLSENHGFPALITPNDTQTGVSTLHGHHKDDISNARIDGRFGKIYALKLYERFYYRTIESFVPEIIKKRNFFTTRGEVRGNCRPADFPFPPSSYIFHAQTGLPGISLNMTGVLP